MCALREDACRMADITRVDKDAHEQRAVLRLERVKRAELAVQCVELGDLCSTVPSGIPYRVVVGARRVRLVWG